MATSSPHLRQRMLEVALSIADQLAERSRVFELSSEGEIAAGRGLVGDAGTALFFAGILQAREEARYRTAMHEYIKAAAHTSGGYVRGLFTGIYGLLAVLQYAMLVEPRYVGLKEKCAQAIGDIEQERFGEVYTSAQSYIEYDLISGRAGEALSMGTAISPEFSRIACDYLVWLLEDSTRWFCVHPVQKDEGARHDIGMAHGLAGILAALAIAAPAEEKYSGALEGGIHSLSTFYAASDSWPAAVGESGTHFARDAWCYGGPGCTAALVLASTRVQNDDGATLASNSLRSFSSRAHLLDNALCHGYAGNALTIGAMAACTGNTEAAAIAEELIERVVAAFDADAPFGYRKFRPEKGMVDSSNLLEGAAGIGLALVTLADECDASWLSLFGLPKPQSKFAIGVLESLR